MIYFLKYIITNLSYNRYILHKRTKSILFSHVVEFNLTLSPQQCEFLRKLNLFVSVCIISMHRASVECTFFLIEINSACTDISVSIIYLKT